MSHVATVDLEIRDLAALAEACKRLGLEVVQGQGTYACWFTKYPKDKWPELVRAYEFDREKLMPPGFAFGEMGQCEHAIRVAGVTDRTGDDAPYEIGIARRRDGRPGYQLLLDEYDENLGSIVGPACGNLKREYAYSVARRQAMAQGFTVNEQRQADGSIRMILQR